MNYLPLLVNVSLVDSVVSMYSVEQCDTIFMTSARCLKWVCEEG